MSWALSAAFIPGPWIVTFPPLVLIAPVSSTWKILRILSALCLGEVYFGSSCFPFNRAATVEGKVPVAWSLPCVGASVEKLCLTGATYLITNTVRSTSHLL